MNAKSNWPQRAQTPIFQCQPSRPGPSPLSPRQILPTLFFLSHLRISSQDRSQPQPFLLFLGPASGLLGITPAPHPAPVLVFSYSFLSDLQDLYMNRNNMPLGINNTRPLLRTCISDTGHLEHSKDLYSIPVSLCQGLLPPRRERNIHPWIKDHASNGPECTVHNGCLTHTFAKC